MTKGTKFRFLSHPSYVNEIFTVLDAGEDWITCSTNKYPGVRMVFARYETTFKMFPVEHLTDARAMMAAANVIANTPIGREIDFSRMAQELGATQ